MMSLGQLSLNGTPNTPPVQSIAQLIVAIDFGTTFTGVAYAHAGPAMEVADPREANRIAENNVFVIKTWPATNREYAEKTPTIIAYNTNPPTWGGKVKVTTPEPKVTHFKLGLEPSVPQYLGLQAPPSGGSPFGKCPQLPQKSAVDFATDYLTCVSKWVHEVYFAKEYAQAFMQRQKMTYYITVPAIWSDIAKSLTRRAAAQALGVPDDNKLVLITEPEAAALYCATTCQEADLADGDRFLVCDAGGGTVVRKSSS
jgi:molecular chaperone DnaK (HSP70)